MRLAVHPTVAVAAASCIDCAVAATALLGRGSRLPVGVMRMIAIAAALLALSGCAARPYAGMGVGTNVGPVHLGTGLSVNPFDLLGSGGGGGAPARAPTTAQPLPPRQLTPIREFVDGNGRLCRDFVETVSVGGQLRQSQGTACQLADGSWVIVAG